MAYSSRTALASMSLVVAVAGVTACGHFGVDIGFSGDDPEAGTNVDGGGDDGSTSADGASDASADARNDGGGGPIVCTGPNCPAIYVAADPVGSDANPGTSDKPVATIQKGIDLAKAVKLPVHVASKAGGKYTEKLVLADGVSLFGAFICASLPCAWDRDPKPAANGTVLFPVDFRGLVIGGEITRATFIDGFWIYGKSGGPDATTMGSSAVTFDGGAATIRGCRIDGGTASTGTQGYRRSYGVVIQGPAVTDARGPRIEGSSVSANTAAEDSIAIFVTTRANVSPATPVNATIRENASIRSGSAPTSIGIRVGAGSAGLTIEDNSISGGPALGLVNQGSWAIWLEKVPVVIHRNWINESGGSTSTSAPNCDSDNVFCGGIKSHGATAKITSNFIRGARALHATAVFLTHAEGGGAGELILNGNTLDPAGGEANPGTVSSAIVVQNVSNAELIVGNVRNNILLGGSNEARYGVYEVKYSTKTGHLAHLENNDFFNSARVNPPKDYAYHFWDGVNEFDYTFEQLDSVTPAPVACLNVAPSFAQGQGFHLNTNSPLIDQGTVAEATEDYDGEKRVLGAKVDIGGDEVK